MKRALETVNFVRSAKMIFGVTGFIFGVTLIIVGLTHTRTVGPLQKEPDVLWLLGAGGGALLIFTAVQYVVLSWMEQTLLALVMIATDPGLKQGLVINTASGYKMRTADERFADDADQAIRLGNGGRGGSATIHGSGTAVGGKGGDA